MLNDAEMLNDILRSAEMGCQGIADVRRHTKSHSIDKVLSTQLIRYGKVYNAANRMLKSRGEDPHYVNKMARVMTRYAAKLDLKRDPSASHIAEMMIKGNTMGVNKMAQHLRDYDRTDPNITLLAKKMLDIEEAHIKELRPYL